MGDLTVFLLHFHRRQVAEPNPSIHAGLRFKVGRFTTNPNTGCRLRAFEPLIPSLGHFSDRTFFVTPVVVRFFSLLSVINIDSLIVCLQVALLSFILLLCSGKLPLRCAAKTGVMQKKRNGITPLLCLSFWLIKYPIRL